MEGTVASTKAYTPGIQHKDAELGRPRQGQILHIAAADSAMLFVSGAFGSSGGCEVAEATTVVDFTKDFDKRAPTLQSDQAVERATRTTTVHTLARLCGQGKPGYENRFRCNQCPTGQGVRQHTDQQLWT